jgi:hypothetical protein
LLLLALALLENNSFIRANFVLLDTMTFHIPLFFSLLRDCRVNGAKENRNSIQFQHFEQRILAQELLLLMQAI